MMTARELRHEDNSSGNPQKLCGTRCGFLLTDCSQNKGLHESNPQFGENVMNFIIQMQVERNSGKETEADYGLWSLVTSLELLSPIYHHFASRGWLTTATKVSGFEYKLSLPSSVALRY
jgi:hypothetical protein